MRVSFSSAASAVLAATVAAAALCSLPTATAELTSAFRSDFDEVVSYYSTGIQMWHMLCRIFAAFAQYS